MKWIHWRDPALGGEILGTKKMRNSKLERQMKTLLLVSVFYTSLVSMWPSGRL